MVQEGLNPLVLYCDPEKPLPKKFVVVPVGEEFTDGPPLKNDPVYGKYFKVGRVAAGVVQGWWEVLGRLRGGGGAIGSTSPFS